jgi:ABC-2 type transport system ATP-binding protein
VSESPPSSPDTGGATTASAREGATTVSVRDGAGAPAARLVDLRKAFGPVVALDGLSAQLPAGKILGLVGPDGAGKTTLIRLLAGLMDPTSGSVEVLGRKPSAEGGTTQAEVGYMPQRFGLYEDLSVFDNLTLYANLRALDRATRERRFAELLEFTALAPFTSRLAGKLSGGMKQKLGLACALLGSPKLLLLDEPGVGVDPLSRRELWRMVSELIASGVTVLWSTAYLEEAERCSRIWLLDRGRLLHDGAPEELSSRMKGRVFRRRSGSGASRRLAENELSRDGVVDAVIQGSSVRIVATAERAHEMERNGYEAVPPRLEDAYIELVGGAQKGESLLAKGWPTGGTADSGAPVPSASESAPAASGRTGAVGATGLNSSESPQAPGPAHGPALVEAHALTKRFGDFVAADHVSFNVRPGEIYGLLGPNGAGKSTTFRMLCGLLKPTEGDASVAGVNLLRSASRARARLGYMAQKFSLYGALSVAQNLDYFADIYGLSRQRKRERVQAMIDAFALEPHLDSNATTLPLGFKQRLALACATLHAPAVLFLDEPTSGVDPLMRREFWHHINAVTARGVAIVITTHFMEEAEYCDRIGLIWSGRKIAEGTPDDLKASIATPARPEPTLEEAFIALIEREAA